METHNSMTPEYRKYTQMNMERALEFDQYVSDNLADEELLEKINGATIVFDEECFQRAKGNGGKVIFAKKTYQYAYA